MQWIQVFTIIVSTFGITSGFFLWARRETNTDIKEIRGMIMGLGAKLDKANDEIKKESREYHGRLCLLEERMKKC